MKKEEATTAKKESKAVTSIKTFIPTDNLVVLKLARHSMQGNIHMATVELSIYGEVVLIGNNTAGLLPDLKLGDSVIIKPEIFERKLYTLFPKDFFKESSDEYAIVAVYTRDLLGIL